LLQNSNVVMIKNFSDFLNESDTVNSEKLILDKISDLYTCIKQYTDAHNMTIKNTTDKWDVYHWLSGIKSKYDEYITKIPENEKINNNHFTTRTSIGNFKVSTGIKYKLPPLKDDDITMNINTGWNGKNLVVGFYMDWDDRIKADRDALVKDMEDYVLENFDFKLDIHELRGRKLKNFGV
jgi:hypothetical protein